MRVITQLLKLPSNLSITFTGVDTVQNIPHQHHVSLYVDCSVTVVDSVTNTQQTTKVDSDWKTEELTEHIRGLLKLAPSKHIRLFVQQANAVVAGTRLT